MKKIVVASNCRGAGKTSMALGMALALDKKAGYVKPFGDRIMYQKKRLWDHDAGLMSSVLGGGEKEDLTIGFAHSKIKYMYDELALKKRLNDMVASAGKKKEAVFIEAGRNLSFGSSVHLDPISMANCTGSKLLLVADGDDHNVLDYLLFIKQYLDVENVDLAGVIVNKVVDAPGFKEAHIDAIHEAGIEIYGVVPYRPELGYMSAGYLSEHVFSKLVAGEDGLDRVIKTMFIGDMSSTAALTHPGFKQESKLVITSGDRVDTIVAALEHNTSCVILTNGIMPPSKIISKASDAGIPMLLAPCDSYHVALQVQKIDSLISPMDKEKIRLVKDLVRSHVDLEALLENG